MTRRLWSVRQVKALNVQVEQEAQKRSFLQNDFTMQSSQMSLLQSRVTQLQRELTEARQARGELLEQLQRLRATRQVDELQTKELADQLEAEQYFTVRPAGGRRKFLFAPCLLCSLLFVLSYLISDLSRLACFALLGCQQAVR